jgi:2-dehydro-3-deoxygluconokinase
MTDVVLVGETMMSLRARGTWRLGADARTSVAGAEATVAIGLSRLGHAARWVGRVGADEPGELVLRTLRAEGVDVSAAVRDPDAPTGLILFEQRTPDVTRVLYHRAGSAGSRLDRRDVTAGSDCGARLLHLTGITPALSATALDAVHAALAHARERRWTVSFDVNFRAKLWSTDRAAAVLSPLARNADVVIGSPDELDLVGGPEPLMAAGVAELVTKHGADGASVRTRDGNWTAPAHRVTAVDTIGAGDAFTAGYLSGLLDDLAPEERLARGNAVGAFAVMATGDWEGLPTRDELDLLVLGDGVALR